MKLKALLNKNWLRILEIVLIPFILLGLGLGIWSNIKLSAWQEDVTITQMVDSYFDGIANHLSSTENDTSYFVTIARSRALFYHLNKLERQSEMINILRFLSEVAPDLLRGSPFEHDPLASKYFIDLSYSNLSMVDIKIMRLEYSHFQNSNFDYSSFENFACVECNLSNSSFRNVSFATSSFEGSDLSHVDFSGSNIEEVYLEGAILDNAKWSDGRKCLKDSLDVCK